MHNSSPAPSVEEAEVIRAFGTSSQFTWWHLLVASGSATAIALAMAAIALSDIEAAVVAAGVLISASLLRFRRGGVGAVGLALLSAVTLFFMGTAAAVNIASGSTLRAVGISAGLAALCLVTLAAAIAVLGGGADHGPAGPSTAVVISLVALMGALAGGVNSDPAAPDSFDAAVVADDLAFSPSEISAAAGRVTVAVANNDLFWHTFTMPELGVDLPVPAEGQRTVTFDAPAGAYEFVCRVPGHTDAGMVGTMIVGN